MNKIISGTLFFCLSIALFFTPNISQKAEAHMLQSSVDELIVQVPNSNDKNRGSIERAIIASKGVEYKGYCSSLHVYMMLVDRSVQANDLFIEQIMKAEGMEYYLKVGTTIETIKASCDMHDNTSPQNSEQ